MKQAGKRVRWDLTNDKAMAEAVRHARIPLCITDPNLSDNPIVFINSAFCDLTGYDEDDVIGKNCRFLQGSDTSDQSIKSVRQAIAAQKVETIEILNYRKDGTSFLNALQIGPILDNEGRLVFYFGSQLDVTEKRDAERRARKLAEEELIHRLRNIVNVMTVVIRMSAREEKDNQAFGSLLSQRLRALSDAHFQTINQPDGENVTLGDLVQTILRAYAPVGDRQFDLQGPELVLPSHLLSCLALCLHELATNAVKYGALSAHEGKVRLGWSVEHDSFEFRWSESGGPAVKAPERYSGSKIVNDLIAAVGGSLDMQWEESGLIATACFPL